MSDPSNVQAPTKRPKSSSSTPCGAVASRRSAIGEDMTSTLRPRSTACCQDRAHLRGRGAIRSAKTLGEVAVACEPELGGEAGKVVLTLLKAIEGESEAQDQQVTRDRVNCSRTKLPSPEIRRGL